MKTQANKTIIIGAGPAGMGCAHALAKAGRPSVVVDENTQPGGLCRTMHFEGYLFDIGGHRFISRSEEVNALWQEIMEGDLLKVARTSRIYYKGRYFKYPLSFMNTVLNLGIFESFLCFMSYVRYKLFPYPERDSFEGWIINGFGKRLYDIFFKTYTEKVWAVPCKSLSSDWATQRIKGLSLKVAVKNAIFGRSKGAPKTLAEEFHYPRTGPGEFYGRLKDVTSSKGAEFLFGNRVTKIRHTNEKIIWIETKDNRRKNIETIAADHLFSSIPLPMLVQLLDPKPPEAVLSAAKRLRFRHFLVVNVILNKEKIFRDQWIYVHSPEVRMGRIQNYKNWSPAMAADIKKTSLGLEYFCDTEDAIWQMNEVDLINFALNELDKLGIASRKEFINGFVVRYKNAYPFYSLGYKKDIEIIRNYLKGFSNLQTMGRAGLFRYDNSDHALLTGIYAAKKFLGQGDYDVWSVSEGDQYLES